MKYVVFCSFFLMILSNFSYAQHSCCTMDANMRFASLASSDEFIKAHANPLPYKADSLMGKMISFPCAGDANGSANLVTSPRPSDRVIPMFHEFWWLKGYIKSEAESLRKKLNDRV